MNTEFDKLAADYEALLKDPLRDRFAPDADFFVERKLDVLLAFLRARRFDTSRALWLDVGCGKGQLLRAGREFFGRVVGCDVSTDMLGAAAGLDVVRQSDPTRIPFADASVDMVSAVCVYHHVEPRDRAALTADIRRVLKPGGVFVMIEHNPFNPVVRLIVRRTPVDANAVLLTPHTARRVMRGAGFRVAATRYFLYLPQRVYRSVRVIERALERAPFGGQYAVFVVTPHE